MEIIKKASFNIKSDFEDKLIIYMYGEKELLATGFNLWCLIKPTG